MVRRPKPREVFAADFRDRIAHHWLALRMGPLLEAELSPRAFACREGKGVLHGVRTLREDIRECSENYTRDCWVMKLDLQNFFMSIDKGVLWPMVERLLTEGYHGADRDDALWLARVVVMHRPQELCVRRSPLWLWDLLPPGKSLFTGREGCGMPIGNLPSQMLANLYLTPLDRLVTETLGLPHYGRYADDFYAVSRDKAAMLRSVEAMRRLLAEGLRLTLHPRKFQVQHYSKGVEFTGITVDGDRLYPGRRMTGGLHEAIARLNAVAALRGIGGREQARRVEAAVESANSYLGLMAPLDSYGVRRRELSRLSDEAWDWVYIRGRYQLLRRRRWPRRRAAPRDEWPGEYRQTDPIDVAGLRADAPHQ